LDDLLNKLGSLWIESESLSMLDSPEALRCKTLALDRQLLEWEASRVVEIKPTAAGHISGKESDAEAAVGCWPGRVDTYFDLYVAGIWNVFRTARLLNAALIIKSSNMLQRHEDCVELITVAHGLVEEIIASIAYHLTDNLQDFLTQFAESKAITDRGRTLGGLLLLHPLYIASETAFLSPEIKRYLRRCLEWIGSHMGIGQATLLARVSSKLFPQVLMEKVEVDVVQNQGIDKNYIASACMLIWTGFHG
jgi:hypothetical protein